MTNLIHARTEVIMKKIKIKICWTCCDHTHCQHRWKWTAWVHGKWLQFWAWEEQFWITEK